MGAINTPTLIESDRDYHGMISGKHFTQNRVPAAVIRVLAEHGLRSIR